MLSAQGYKDQLLTDLFTTNVWDGFQVLCPLQPDESEKDLLSYHSLV